MNSRIPLNGKDWRSSHLPGDYGMRVWKEIQPELPSCVSLNDPPGMLVLKPGNFGKRTSLSEHWNI
jgi:hypothetical protein